MVTRLFLNNKKSMKKILLIIVTIITSATLNAQDKDVTKFLGIPVDGTKAAMIQKLKAKGFTSNPYDKDVLEGEFNGKDVHIYVATNNNKVYRIALVDKNPSDETGIRIRFNNLCAQFENNKKYMSPKDQRLPNNTDISYGIRIENKQYEASFYQLPTIISDKNENELFNETLNRHVWFTIQEEKYGKYCIYMFYDNDNNCANGEDL